MAFTKTPFYKSSTFWTSFAVAMTGFASAIHSTFDAAFLDQHPIFAAILGAVGLIVMGIAGVGYAIARAMTRQAELSSDTTSTVNNSSFVVADQPVVQ